MEQEVVNPGVLPGKTADRKILYKSGEKLQIPKSVEERCASFKSKRTLEGTERIFVQTVEKLRELCVKPP